MKIIDAHAHIVEYFNGLGARGELRALGNGMVEYADGKKFQIIPNELGDKGFSYESLLKEMDKYNVERAVLLQGNYLGFQNLYTYEAMTKYPNRFIGACTIDPFSKQRESIAKHLLGDLGFKIIKMELSNTSGLMSNHHDFDLLGEEMIFIYELAKKYNAILTLDIGRPGNPCYQVNQLREAIRKYPQITFVICHLTSPQFGQEDLLKENLEMLNLNNVYFDLASLPNNTKEDYPFKEALKYLSIAKEIVGTKKLMFGSDIPSALMKTNYQNFINYIKNSHIFNNDELNDIFYQNALNVYFK